MKLRKKLLRTVKLRFFEDSANGEWGVTHEETQQCKHGGDDGFNAFWDGRGLFHDVFEHAHEYTNEFFRGTCAMNIGGEIAAMGSLWYFYSQLGMSRRLDNPFFGYQTMPADENTLRSTLDMMQEAIQEGYCNYGSTLESCVPNLPECDDSTIEWLAEEHFNRIQALEPKGHDSDDKERGTEYKNSVTLEKLQNLYRYGYKMAEDLFPGGKYRNGGILSDFMEFWTEFCKKNRAENIAQLYRSLTFKIYRDSDGLCHWTAIFQPDIGAEGVERVTLKGGPDGVPEFVPILADF
jgi:hypothetical protein